MTQCKPAVIVAYYGGADVLTESNKRGYPCVRIQLHGHDTSNQYLKQYLKGDTDPSSHVVIQEEGESVASLAERLKTLGVTHIIPSDEAGVELTDKLCDVMGLPFNGIEGSKARRNKSLMHQKIASHNVRIPFQTTATSMDEVMVWLADHNLDFPIVVKPLDGAGSAGVTKCESAFDVQVAFDEIKQIAELKKTVVSIGQEVIVQEFLQGIEYVVDTVSNNGVHKLTDIWECKKAPHNGASFVYEYFDLLHHEGDLQDRLYAYVCLVLDALDIRTGPGHAEIYVKPDGTPVIVEIGSRLGGPRMPYGTAPCVASGKAQTEFAVDAYLEPEKHVQNWDERYEKTRHSRMVFLIHGEERPFIGINESVIQQIRGLPSYYHEEFAVSDGDLLKKTIDVRSSPGFIYLIHDDSAQIEADYDAIRGFEASLYR